MTKNYYVEMDGAKCDRRLIELANGAVAGAGDGRISIDDAKALFAQVEDGDTYTDIEKTTMKYIREHGRGGRLVSHRSEPMGSYEIGEGPRIIAINLSRRWVERRCTASVSADR